MDPSTSPRRRDHRRIRPGTPVLRATGIVFSAALVLAGCSAGGDDATAAQDDAGSAAAAPSTVTVTASSESPTAPDTASATSESRTTSTTTTAPTTPPCDPATVPVAENAASIAQPFPDRGWTVYSSSNLCGTLGYAELATQGGTGSSPTQLLLYNYGEFLGTGISCNALGQVIGSTDQSVSVEYRWPEPGDSNADMSGRANVMFQWNGSSVDMVGALPNEVTGGAC